jgi:ribosomal protein L14
MKRAAKIGQPTSLFDIPLSFPSSPIVYLSHNSLTYPPSGDRIIVVVQKQRNFGPETGPGGQVSISAANKVRRGDIRHAVVVRTAKKLQRKDGSVVRFDDNACVLINKTGEPIGSRLNGLFNAPLNSDGFGLGLTVSRCCRSRATG